VVPTRGSEAPALRPAFADPAADTGTHPILSPRARKAEPPPRDPTDPGIPERRDPSSSTTTQKRVAACGPPVLASQALREDLKPTQPGSRAVRLVCVAVGLVGVV